MVREGEKVGDDLDRFRDGLGGGSGETGELVEMETWGGQLTFGLG